MSTESSHPLRFIFGRRSIRSFAPAEVSEETITALLEAAMAAPSARAHDPWRFVAVRQRETLEALAAVLPYGRMLATAGAGIAVCGDPEAAFDRQLSYLLQDCSAAIENILIAASALGLGTCWIGLHPREDRMRDIRNVLSIPGSILPLAVVAIGQPGEHKKPRTRFNADYVHREKW